MKISEEQLKELCCSFARIYWHQTGKSEVTNAENEYADFRDSGICKDILNHYEDNFNL